MNFPWLTKHKKLQEWETKYENKLNIKWKKTLQCNSGKIYLKIVCKLTSKATTNENRLCPQTFLMTCFKLEKKLFHS